MDSSGEQFHHNWRALATVQLRPKRFVRAGDGAPPAAVRAERKYEIQGVRGVEVKEFYDQLVNEETSPKQMHRNVATVGTKLQDKLPKPQDKSPFDSSKYFRFATANNVAGLQALDYAHSDVNCRDSFGWTALMMAACEGGGEAVAFLISLDVDKEARNKVGQTALQLATRRGHAHIVDLLQGISQEQVLVSTTETDARMATPAEPFYCDTCKRTFAETTRREHESSTVHQFNDKTHLPPNKLHKFNIPPRNRGLQLMVKQGWDKESGLGPTQAGRLYPVKTCIRKKRTGLGIEQASERVTHFEAFDRRATQRNDSCYYRKKPQQRNDMKREKMRDWKRERRLRNELS